MKFICMFDPKKADQAASTEAGLALISATDHPAQVVHIRDTGARSKASKLAGRSVKLPRFFAGDPVKGTGVYPKQRNGGIDWLRGYLGVEKPPEAAEGYQVTETDKAGNVTDRTPGKPDRADEARRTLVEVNRKLNKENGQLRSDLEQANKLADSRGGVIAALEKQCAIMDADYQLVAPVQDKIRERFGAGADVAVLADDFGLPTGSVEEILRAAYSIVNALNANEKGE